MFLEALNTCIIGINAAFNFFDRIMSAIPGAFSFILAMIGVFSIGRLLIRPIMGVRIGSGASDVVRKIRGSEKEKQ